MLRYREGWLKRWDFLLAFGRWPVRNIIWHMTVLAESECHSIVKRVANTKYFRTRWFCIIRHKCTSHIVVQWRANHLSSGDGCDVDFALTIILHNTSVREVTSCSSYQISCCREWATGAFVCWSHLIANWIIAGSSSCLFHPRLPNRLKRPAKFSPVIKK